MGGILGDDMGLGKTIQTAAFLAGMQQLFCFPHWFSDGFSSPHSLSSVHGVALSAPPLLPFSLYRFVSFETGEARVVAGAGVGDAALGSGTEQMVQRCEGARVSWHQQKIEKRR